MSNGGTTELFQFVHIARLCLIASTVDLSYQFTVDVLKCTEIIYYIATV